MPPSPSGARAVVALFLGLALCLSLFQASILNFGPRQADRAERHQLILERQGDAPWTYRVLMPALAQVTSRVPQSLGVEPRDAVEVGYVTWQVVFTAALLLAFHRYVATWLDPPWALATGLLFAALQAPSYAWYWFQPDSLPDLLLWVLVANLSLGPPALPSGERKSADGWLFPLVLVGTLNRETAVFAVALHGLLRWGREPWKALLLRCLALGACWLAVFLGVRRWVGEHGWAHGGTPLGYLQANFTHPTWLLYAASFFGILWLAPWVRRSGQPVELRRMALLMVPYLVLQLLFGRIREVRLLLPLSLALLPLGALWLRERLTPRQVA